MTSSESHDEVHLPEDLTEALRDNPEAAAIWNNLSVAHRRGHVIARGVLLKQVLDRVLDSFGSSLGIRNPLDQPWR
jgi:uncharacterized protein YdeI (YjbR/CyaY-like superfamily)